MFEFMEELRTALDTPLPPTKLLEILKAYHATCENEELKTILVGAMAKLETKHRMGGVKPVTMRKGRSFAALRNFIEEGRIAPPEAIFEDTYLNESLYKS